MKTKLLLFSLLFCLANANAQCGGTPPPPGLSIVYGLDTDNDGFALFDIQYYADHVTRPELQSFFGVSSSGYYPAFYAHNVLQPSLLYTNTSQNQECGLGFVYSGSGPEFAPQPPCYWNVEIHSGRNLYLITVPFDGDFDNDGIQNASEDTNHNLNLMDDDDDSDGIINFKDATNDLATVQHTTVTLNVYPNPVTNGVLTFDSNVTITAVTICDVTGKQVSQNKINSNTLNVGALSPGVYFFKFQSEDGNAFKKVIIR